MIQSSTYIQIVIDREGLAPSIGIRGKDRKGRPQNTISDHVVIESECYMKRGRRRRKKENIHSRRSQQAYRGWGLDKLWAGYDVSDELTILFDMESTSQF